MLSNLHKFSLDQSADSKILQVGVGLMSTWKSHTNHSMWIGYQVIYGLGIGAGMQQPYALFNSTQSIIC